MKIQYRTGNLFDANETVIVHGCNNRGGFGSGFAGQIRKLYPPAYVAYLNHHDADAIKLGTIHIVQCDGRMIVNAITQDGYGRDGRQYVNYDAVREVFRAVQALSVNPDGTQAFDSIVLPTVGAGLGGGSWAVISPIIEEECKTVQPIVYLFDGKMP